MKSSLKILSGLFFITSILYCTKRDKQEINISIINNAVVFKENKNIESAKLELKTALIKNEILPDKVISNSETAVNVAEIVLFSIYGKKTSPSKDLMTSISLTNII